MPNPIILIDNNLELECIEKQHPELIDASLILLSSNFSPQQLELYQERGYSYFDELITKEEAVQLSNSMHHLLWNWFIDEKNNDLSLINGCSLGAAFVSSVQILLSTLLRYSAGLKKILKKENNVYISSKALEICLDVVAFLQEEIGFTLSEVEVTESKKIQTYGSDKLKVDGRIRDLEPIFKRSGIKEKIIGCFLKYTQRKNVCKNRVMFFPGGKHESYLEYLKTKKNDRVSWVIPYNQGPKIFGNRNNNILFHYFRNIGKENHGEIKRLVSSLECNIERSVNVIDPKLLIKLMRKHTFNYFNGAYNYYLNVVSALQVYKTNLVILSADNYETFILAAQAAKKLKVCVAITAHGLNFWGSKQYRSGRFKIFDYALAFGKQDVDYYSYAGTDLKNIQITSFPYFERFFPIRNKKNVNRYKKTLLLSPDVINNSTLEKTDSEYKYYKDVSLLLKELGIILVGIKNRYAFRFRNIGLPDNELVIDGTKIPLLSGYSSFPEAAKKVDFIIGPASSALIEAGLMGIDYYVFQHTRFHDHIPNMSPTLFDYVNGSFNMEQLKENIKNRQPYKEDCSVYDLIDLSDVQTKKDLYQKYDSGVKAVLEDVKN